MSLISSASRFVFVLGAAAALAGCAGTDSRAPSAAGAADPANLKSALLQTLDENPDLLDAALTARAQKMQKAEADAKAAAFQAGLHEHSQALLDPQMLPVLGNLKGDVTIIEFFDFNCHYCRDEESIVQTVLAADRGVRVIPVDMSSLTPDSYVAARYAMAAQNQGHYREFRDMLMAQKVLTDEKLCEDVGRRLNLDMDRLRQDAYSPAIQGEVLQQRKLAIDLKVDGTPAFIVMDSSGTGEPIAIAGAIPLKQFAAAIAQVRGQAKTI